MKLGSHPLELNYIRPRYKLVVLGYLLNTGDGRPLEHIGFTVDPKYDDFACSSRPQIDSDIPSIPVSSPHLLYIPNLPYNGFTIRRKYIIDHTRVEDAHNDEPR